MIGVVLWSDPSGGKAVFWCEDQGDLAYFENVDHVAEERNMFFDAGDMVQFDVTHHSNRRLASNAKLLEEQGYVGLPDSLRRSADPRATPAGPQSAQIIPFTQTPREQEDKRQATLLKA